MTKQVSVTLYSDVLCIWAYISQVRVDEVRRHFADSVVVDYRFCSVFGDTAYKVSQRWGDRGGFRAFGEHVRQVAEPFAHVRVHQEVWYRDPPASSMPAHLVLKAMQSVDRGKTESLLREIRRAFFENCLDIGSWSVLESCITAVGASVDDIRARLDDGRAHADLEADNRDRETLMVQGSPTLILNEGRQKLYGNVGYGVIEANINELLVTPDAGSASWC